MLQKVFKFRTCTLDIDENDSRWRWYRPCLLHFIDQCTAPCNFRISKEQYRKDIHRLQRFLEGGKNKLLGEMREEMAAAAGELQFEEAARLRDEIQMLETLDDRGRLETHVQPEVFPTDPKRGLAGLKKVLHLEHRPRTIEGIDIAHLAGTDTVASVVQFIDGLPFKPGYRRMRIQGVAGPDDTASIYEAVARRFRHLQAEGESPPDILLIDGGRGQLNAALAAIASLGSRTADRHFAGQARGAGLYAGGRGAPAPEPPQLCPAAAAVRSRRSPPLRSALSPHLAEEVAVGRAGYPMKRKTGYQAIGDDKAREAEAFEWAEAICGDADGESPVAEKGDSHTTESVVELSHMDKHVVIQDVSWERMERAVEKVRQRLLRAASTLEQAGVPYAVVGGNAVAAWVSRVDEAAVRNTRDVDILIRRQDLPAAVEAMSKAGFVHRHAAGIDMLLDGPDAKARDAVHLVFAGEKVRPEYLLPTPDVTESEQSACFRLLSLESLVRMKLTSFRDKDRTHLRDLLEVGLIDATWRERFPPELAARLQELVDHPEG